MTRTIIGVVVGVVVGLSGGVVAAHAAVETVQVPHIFSYDGRDLGPAPCYIHPNHPELNVCTLLQPPPA